MTETEIIAFSVSLGVIITMILIAIVGIHNRPKWKAQEKLRRQQIEEEYEKEPEYKYIRARVLEKKSSAYYASFRQPRLITEWKIKFLMETGEEKEFFVSESFYKSIEENQVATLVTVNGNLFDFGDGRDIEEETDQILYK